MVKLSWVTKILENFAPICLAEDWDNVGLLVGDSQMQVSRVLVALDATPAVIDEAVAGGYNLIITHHAPIYQPLKNITTTTATGRKIIKLLKNDIALYTAHTNLDAANGGVNDRLAKVLGIVNTQPMVQDKNNIKCGIGRVGCLPVETTLAKLAQDIAETLGLRMVRYCGNGNAKIKKVALCGGSGMSYVSNAHGNDVYITGDIKYGDANTAVEAGLNLIDITHYAGELPVLDVIVDLLRTNAANQKVTLQVDKTTQNGQIFCQV